MVRHLSLADGFVLALVYVDDARRAEADALFDGLADVLSRAKGSPVRVTRLRSPALGSDPCVGTSADELVDAVLSAIESAREETSAIVVDGTLATGPEDDAWIELFERLNERRNAVRARHRGPLVLAVHARLEGAFARNAPDLWSIRGPVVRLAEPDGTDADIERPQEPGFLATDLARIDAACATDPSPARRARWRVRRALCAMDLGLLDDARRDLDALAGDPCAAEPDLQAWRALLRGDLAREGDPLARAEEWSRAADALEGRAAWPIVVALRLRASDVLAAQWPERALRALDAAMGAVPRGAPREEVTATDIEVATRRVDLLGARDPASARALARALVEEVRAATGRSRRIHHQRWLAHALIRAGDLDAQAGDPAGAVAAWTEALALVRALRVRDPARASWQRGEAMLTERLAANG